jgi:uncharacterized membrane protein YraQ (UPF0718 family)
MLGLAGSALLLARLPRRDRAMPARVAIARPWPGVEAFTLAARSLGWLTTTTLLLAASALAALATLLMRRASGPPAASAPREPSPSRPALPFWVTLEALVLRAGGWIALGLLGQSYIESFVLGAEPLASLDTAAGALLTLVLATASSVCSAGAVPIAAALVDKGLSAMIAIAGLALGPVLSNAVNVQRRAGVGLAHASLAVAPLALGTLGLALWLPTVLAAPAQAADVASPGLVEWAALAGLGAIVAKSIWRVGIRGWLGSSLRSLGPATRRQHAHAH